MLYENCMQRCAICAGQGVNWDGGEDFWADCGYVCGEAGGWCVVCLRPYYTTTSIQLSRKNFSRCFRIFIFVHRFGSLRWQFSFLRQARNIFNFHFCKTAGQSGCPVSFSFAMAAKPIYHYCTLLDKAANRLLNAVGRFDKRYVCELQLEKNLCDIAFCYIFIPKCDMAKWYIGIWQNGI